MYCSWGCKIVQPLWKKKLEDLSKAKPRIGMWPINSTLDISWRTENMHLYSLSLIVALSTIAKYPSRDEWNKMQHIYTMEYYLTKERIQYQHALQCVERSQPITNYVQDGFISMKYHRWANPQVCSFPGMKARWKGKGLLRGNSVSFRRDGKF